MKRHKRLIIFAGIVVAVLGLVAAAWLVAAAEERDRTAYDRGHARLAQAVQDMLAEDPSRNRPCFGTAPLQTHTYQELASLPMADIRAMLRKDSGICPE